MDIDTSYFNNYLNSIKDNVSGSSEYSKLKDSISTTGKDSSDDELMEVCKQFESYFVEQVFKEMEKTIPKTENGLNTSNQLVDYYKDNLRQKLSSEAAEQQGLGLAQKMYEQMKRNYSAITPSEPETEGKEVSE